LLSAAAFLKIIAQFIHFATSTGMMSIDGHIAGVPPVSFLF